MAENQYRGAWTPFSWVEKYQYAFSGSGQKAALALTFDDGPDPDFTPRILAILRKYHVKATFFLLGENMEKYPLLVKEIAAAGHVIGNHTYSHPKLPALSMTDFEQEIFKTDVLVQHLAGYRPRFIRPTYGAITEEQVAWLTREQMMVIQWSVDTLDWKGLSPEEITKTVEGNALPGSIILQHNAEGVPLDGTVVALEQFIPRLQAKGARFVTVAEMFDLPKER